MSNSSLVNYTKISPNSTNPRNNSIKKITIHHAAGNTSVETLGNIFANPSRRASANYGIGSDGRVGLYVDEANRSWCSSNADNDNQAITIEVANDGGEPEWHISDKALAKLIELCVDICKRNGIERLNYTGNKSGNLTMHCWFAATSCPGPYLKSKFSYIADEVNKRLVVSDNTEKELYRVRVSWDNPASQIGAYSVLNNAIKVCKDGYKVFNSKGNVVYPNSVEKVLNIGDKVRLLSGATYYDGANIPSWVFKKVLYVREKNKERIVISTQKSGAITGAVHIKFLEKG